jgi:hypothetical protein
MKISVIICTYNPREDYLRRVLDALHKQTLPMTDWELLLIDNASQFPVMDRFDLSWCLHGRHLREEKPGKINAWLLGVRGSKADVLVFVDDDNVLAPNYLEQSLVIANQWPFVGVWGGSIIPEFETPLPSWVGEFAWMLTIEEVKEDVWSNFREGYKSIPSGAGMCVRRQVGERYLEWCKNGSSMALDRSGEGHGGYGDIDQAHCAIDIGLGTGKSTRLNLTHLIPSSRLTLSYFLQKSEEDAVSVMLFRAIRRLPVREPEPTSLIGSLRWFLHRLIHRIPREQYEIQKAHRRGLEKGWKLAQAYFKENLPPIKITI